MGATILIIDDDLPLVKSLAKDLRASGFEVLTAPDGMIGVREALRQKPNLIILELHFPAGGAFFVLQNVRRSLHTCDIPILIFTDSTDPSSKKRLLEFGLLTYVQKPCEREALFAEIHKLLGNAHSEPPEIPNGTIVATGDFTSPSPPAKRRNLPGYRKYDAPAVYILLTVCFPKVSLRWLPPRFTYTYADADARAIAHRG
jgi:DNA-binding response OmpR family regulator